MGLIRIKHTYITVVVDNTEFNTQPKLIKAVLSL